ncbi:MAG: DUF6178 family protein [Myxococcota bacterium]
MTLSRTFAPEARRLLTLARSDKRAAEQQLGALTPKRQASVVCETPHAIRRQLIELLPNPEAVIPLIPEAEFCYTCRSIGLADAHWLLPMASENQIVACFDLDTWRGLQIDLQRLDDWVAALSTTETETIVRAARALDPELIVIYLRAHIDVSIKPSEQDDPDWSPPDRSQTLEGQFYFVAKDPKDDLTPMLILFHALFQEDYWLYFRVIQAVLEELAPENEEWALRWRTGRLEDLGFPSWDKAMRIYGFLRPDRMSELSEKTAPLETRNEFLPIESIDLPGAADDERALFRATRELEADERNRIFYALISLANRVAVADRMELGDPDSLPLAIDKATRFASDGLEYIATKNELSLEKTLRSVSIERLFRVGTNLDRDAALPTPLPVDNDGDGDGDDDDAQESFA